MNNIKKIIAGIITPLTVIGAVTPTTVAAESQATYETVLGDGLNYGIVADSYEQTVHTQTNFATNNYIASGQVVEANLSGEANVPVITSEITGQLRFGGSTAGSKPMTYNVITSDQYADGSKLSSDGADAQIKATYKSSDEVKKIVNGFISTMKASSESLKNHEASITLTDDMVNDQNHYTLDLTGYGNDTTVYVNVPSDASKFIQVLTTTDALNIQKNSGTTVVFNVASDSIRIGKYHVTVDGNQINTETSVGESDHNYDVDREILQKVIWNLYNASNVDLNVTAGLFMVPNSNAKIIVSGTSAGWISTAGSVLQNGGEWHFTFHSRTSTGDTEVVPTPVPTPDVPEPTPEPVEPEPEKGTLLITKQMAGDVTKEEAERALKFVVTNNDTQESNTYTLADFDFKDGKYTLELEEVAGGYTVKETDYDINGYETAYVGYQINGVVTESDKADITINKDETFRIDFADTYSLEKHDVVISKVDINNSEELAGAKLQVLQNDKIIEEWISTKEKHTVALKPGDYTLKEITAPDGYEVAEDMAFTVDRNGTVTVFGQPATEVVMKDKPLPKPVEKTTVTVNKVFEDGDNADGIRPLYVEVTLLADGKEVTTAKLDNDNNWTYIFTGLDKTKDENPIVYTVKETPVNGYTATISGNTEDGFTITNTHEFETTDIVVDTEWDDLDNLDQFRPDEYEISLLADECAVDDATLTIENDFSHTFEDMPVKDNGHEIEYDVEMKTDIDKYDSKLEGNFKDGFTFTHIERSQEPVIEKGKLVITKQLEGEITPEEAEGSLKFVVTNNDTQASETFTLADFDLADGKYTLELEENVGGYTVKETDFDINGFETSVSYTINGTTSNGSEAAITVDRDTTTQIDFVDSYELSKHDVVISKVDINSSAELPGATLQVLKEGTLVEEWVSTADKHTIALKPGDYTLKEITAPDGYEVAESIDFSVDRNGKVTVNGNEVTEIVMKDALKPAPEPVKTDVSISKVDISGDEIEGASLMITCNGEVVEHWTSTKETHLISLPEGKYVLTETQAPFGYEIAESIEFEVGNNGKVVGHDSNKITMIDAYNTHDVTITKTDVGGKELPDAHLSILNKDNSVVESWISASAPRTVQLVPGDYVLHEDVAPAGYNVTNDIAFNVAVDGTVTVNGEVVTTITMVDEAKEAVVPTPTPEKPDVSVETPKPAEQPKQDNPVRNVEASKSGIDDANTIIIGSSAVLAIVAGIAMLIVRHRKEEQ